MFTKSPPVASQRHIHSTLRKTIPKVHSNVIKPSMSRLLFPSSVRTELSAPYSLIFAAPIQAQHVLSALFSLLWYSYEYYMKSTSYYGPKQAISSILLLFPIPKFHLFFPPFSSLTIRDEVLYPWKSADKTEKMKAPRPHLLPSHFLIQEAPGAISPRIKETGPEPGHSSQTGTKRKNVWTYTATLPYAFMAVVRNSA